MWLAPAAYAPGVKPGGQTANWIEITLGTEPVAISGLRLWNYNRSADDTFRGVRRMTVTLEGGGGGGGGDGGGEEGQRVLLTPSDGAAIRKAPGTDAFDFGQTVPLRLSVAGATDYSGANYVAEASSGPVDSVPVPLIFGGAGASHNAGDHNAVLAQGFETPLLPSGHVLQLQLLSTWGDADYIGLTGVEVFGPDGRRIPIGPSQVGTDGYCSPRHMISFNVRNGGSKCDS